VIRQTLTGWGHAAWGFVRGVALSIHRNQMTDLAAQLAYWALLAMFPSLIFMLTVIGYLPLRGVDRVLLHEIYRVMPSEAAQLVDHTIHEVIGRQRGVLLIASLFGTLWSGSRSVGGVIGALNRAHGVGETRSFLRLKLLEAAVTLTAALLTVIAMTALMIGPGVVKAVVAFFGVPWHLHHIWAWIRWPLSIFAMLLSLGAVYYVLPNVRRSFRLITPGSAVALALWIGASLLFRLYVSWFHAYARTYGTLATAIVLMTWLQLTALAVLVGGEIDAEVERRRRPPTTN
jgi:membrane protein